MAYVSPWHKNNDGSSGASKDLNSDKGKRNHNSDKGKGINSTHRPDNESDDRAVAVAMATVASCPPTAKRPRPPLTPHPAVEAATATVASCPQVAKRPRLPSTPHPSTRPDNESDDRAVAVAMATVASCPPTAKRPRPPLTPHPAVEAATATVASCPQVAKRPRLPSTPHPATRAALPPPQKNIHPPNVSVFSGRVMLSDEKENRLFEMKFLLKAAMVTTAFKGGGVYFHHC